MNLNHLRGVYVCSLGFSEPIPDAIGSWKLCVCCFCSFLKSIGTLIAQMAPKSVMKSSLKKKPDGMEKPEATAQSFGKL